MQEAIALRIPPHHVHSNAAGLGTGSGSSLRGGGREGRVFLRVQGFVRQGLSGLRVMTAGGMKFAGGAWVKGGGAGIRHVARGTWHVAGRRAALRPALRLSAALH